MQLYTYYPLHWPNPNLIVIEAKKLLLKGVTIIAASGDSGASNARGDSTCGYNPIFPASSIYVTSVGATQGPEWGEADQVYALSVCLYYAYVYEYSAHVYKCV